MKKVIMIPIVSVAFMSCASVEAGRYADIQDVIRLEKKIKKNEFALKQTLTEVISLKETIKELNHQLEKQNRINEELRKKISFLEKEKQKKAEKESGLYGHIKVSFTFLRSSPMWSNNKIIKLRRGTKVEVLERIGQWYKVKANGYKGYLHVKTVEIGG